MKRLKKMRQILTGSALAVLVAASPSLAATAPVVFNGDALGSAELQGGRTYLPFRAIFEACGATVDWDAATGIITAESGKHMWHTRTAVVLQVGHSTAKIYSSNVSGVTMHKLDTAPYIKNGRTYVPLRFVSETLGYDVEWDNDAKQVNITAPTVEYKDGEVTYALNTDTGEIVLRQAGQNNVIGVCDLTRADDYMANHLQVGKTGGGNYLAGVNTFISGAITMSARLYTWMNPATGECYTVNGGNSHWERQAEPLVVDDTVWMGGNGEVYQINDAEGRLIKHWQIGGMMAEMTGSDSAEAVLEWANDEYMLISSGNTLHWGLVNLADGTVTDITDALLTAEVIKRIDDKARPVIEPNLPEGRTYDADYREYFWGGFRSAYNMEECAKIVFVKEEDGVLLQVHPNAQAGIELEYALK